MATLTVQKGNSKSEEFPADEPFVITTNGDAQPYDVNIETKGQFEPDSAYTRIEPLQRFGVQTVTDTGDNTFASSVFDDVIRVTVTNNSGEELSVSVDLDAADRDEFFLRNGKSLLDAKEVNADGVSVTNQMSADSVRTEQERIDSTIIRAYGSVSGEAYQDYQISDYADIGAAFNQAVSDIINAGREGRVILPPGTFTPDTQLKIPEVKSASAQGGIEVVGQGGLTQATTLQPASGFSANTFIYVDGEDNGNTMHFRGVQIRDPNGHVNHLLLAESVVYSTFRDVWMYGKSSIDLVRIFQNNAGDDFAGFFNCRFDPNTAGMVGLQLEGNAYQLYGVHCKGDPNDKADAAIQWEGNAGRYHGDITNVNTGLDLRGGNYVVTPRFENPGVDVPTPIDADDAIGVRYIPLANAHRSYANSKWGALNVELVGAEFHHHPYRIGPGGAETPPGWAATADVVPVDGFLKVEGTGGSDAHVDLGGNVPYLGDHNNTPRLEGHVFPSTANDASISRWGFAESVTTPFDNWAGVRYDDSTADGWHIVVREGGSDVVDTDTGYVGGVECAVTLEKNGDVSVYLQNRRNRVNRDFARATLGADYSNPEPFAYQVNATSNARSMRVYYTDLKYITRP